MIGNKLLFVNIIHTHIIRLDMLHCLSHSICQKPFQVGPTATKAFYEFLVRLQLRCAEANENHLKELMLKLVYTLTSER